MSKYYNLCDSAVFCALHDQLASSGRHAQLTRCFSAVAELLVNTMSCNIYSRLPSETFDVPVYAGISVCYQCIENLLITVNVRKV